MKRSYGQNCALATALDKIGERWTLLIARELLIGPRRYGDLLSNLQGIGTNLLADRLKHMQAQGLIEKTGQQYRLTALGHRLGPVIWQLVRFGLAFGVPEEPGYLSRPEWDSVALRALYMPERDIGLSGRYVLELGGTSNCVEKIGDDVRVTPGECADPRARVSLSKRCAQQLADGELTLDKGIRRRMVRISGSVDDARQLLHAFGLHAVE